MLCSEASLVKTIPGAIMARVMWCRAWTCDLCFETRRNQLIATAASGHPERLITFTTRLREGADPNQEARFQGECLRSLVRKANRLWPGAFAAYFVVREATKRGWPHLHVLQRGTFIKWAWLSEEWERLTGSPGVDIRKIHQPAEAASYVAKYIGKSAHKFGTCKRYWSTRNWDLEKWEPEEEPRRRGEGWEISHWSISWIEETWRIMGYRVEAEGDTLTAWPGAP